MHVRCFDVDTVHDSPYLGGNSVCNYEWMERGRAMTHFTIDLNQLFLTVGVNSKNFEYEFNKRLTVGIRIIPFSLHFLFVSVQYHVCILATIKK